VDQATLPEGATQTHSSLFDGSNCGIRAQGQAGVLVQYHPEPQGHYLFKRFAT